MSKPKVPKKRNPIGKAASKMRTKIVPDKKKAITYNSQPLFGDN